MNTSNHMIIVMMTLRKLLLLVVVIEYCAASPLQSPFKIQPDSSARFRQCWSPANCSINECCATHPLRYPTPTCSPLKLEGQPCIPNPKEFNSKSLYPNGSKRIPNVHWVICPCAPHLTCDWHSGVCSSSSKSPPSSLNHL